MVTAGAGWASFFCGAMAMATKKRAPRKKAARKTKAQGKAKLQDFGERVIRFAEEQNMWAERYLRTVERAGIDRDVIPGTLKGMATFFGIQSQRVRAGDFDYQELDHLVDAWAARQRLAREQSAPVPLEKYDPKKKHTEVADSRLERLCDQLTPQQDKIVRFLWDKKRPVFWGTVGNVAEAFREQTPGDATLEKALKRLRFKLSKVYRTGQCSLDVEVAKKRVRLNRVKTEKDK